MEIVSQRVLFPENVTLDEQQRSAMEEIEEDLHRLGFILEYESDNRWLITSLPAMLKKGSEADIVLRILDSVNEDSSNYGNDGRGDVPIAKRAALIMARSAAVRRGDRLGVAEMENLVGRLFSLPDPSLTPNGNRIFAMLDERQIDRMF